MSKSNVTFKMSDFLNYFLYKKNYVQFHSKLINLLQIHILNAINNKTSENELLYKTTKNLQYIMKFVIRSRILFAKLNDDRDQDMFERSLEGNFQATRKSKNNIFHPINSDF